MANEDETAEDETARPLHAQIVTTDKEHTLAWVVLFDKPIYRQFREDRHHNAAVEWVNEWNQHFEKEWMALMETNALVMDAFVQALLKRGVTAQVVSEALQEVQSGA